MKINLNSVEDLIPKSKRCEASKRRGEHKKHSKTLYINGQVVYHPTEENGLQSHTGGFYGL